MINFENEIFRPVSGFPGHWISASGAVLTDWTQKITPKGQKLPSRIDKEMRRRAKQSTGNHGYFVVGLHVEGRRESVIKCIHRLVLEAWKPRQLGKPITRHLNGNKKDNRIENLEWGTYSENLADAIRHGGHPIGEKKWNAKLTEDNIREIRILLKKGKRQRSAIARRFSVCPASIKQVEVGKTWSHVK